MQLHGNYIMADNAGHRAAFLPHRFPALTSPPKASPAAGTQVTITDLSNANGWDFAIDNVTFNQALTVGAGATPVPAALPMGIVSLSPLLPELRSSNAAARLRSDQKHPSMKNKEPGLRARHF